MCVLKGLSVGVERRFYINVLFHLCMWLLRLYHFLVSVFFASMFTFCLIKASESAMMCLGLDGSPRSRRCGAEPRTDFLCWISFGFTIFLFFIFLSMFFACLFVYGLRQMVEQNTHIHTLKL